MRADRFARLKEILMRLEDLAEGERSAFLDDAFKDDPELRREAELLLAHSEHPHEILKTGAVVPTGALIAGDESALPAMPDVADHVAGYRIVRTLGEGGMGKVYQAEDSRLRRSVALKFVRPGTAGGEHAKARLVLEAQAAAALDHPNICTIYEINESEGRIFIAMAYVEGTTLGERIASGPLSIEDAVNIGLQIALGLREAHAKGIIHRDLKPSNVMLSSSGPVKIMDFGLARTSDRSEITKTGARIGTMGYMSPEQMRGDKIDARADIWALGVVLHEMLVGRLPFKGDTDHTLGYNIVHERAQPIGTIRGDVPQVLEALIERCLEKRPDDRPHAADVVQVLEALGQPSREADAAALLGARRRPGTRLLVISGLALAALAATLGLWQVWFSDDGGLPSEEPRLKRITDFSYDVSTSLLPGSISPDGRYLAVPLRRLRGDWAALGVISVETGKTRHIAAPEGEVYSVGWMPDGETLLTFEYRGDLPWRERQLTERSRTQIWLRNIVLNTSRKIYEHPTYTGRLWPAASPDGSKIAMFRGDRQSIWIMDSSGHALRKVQEVPASDWLGNPVWSPNSMRVAYVRSYEVAGAALADIETCDLLGRTTVVIEGDADLDAGREYGTLCWLPDGRLLFVRFNNFVKTTSELWSVQVDPLTGLRGQDPEPFLALEEAAIGQPTTSADGRRMSFYKWQDHALPRLLELNATGDSVGVGRWASQDWSAMAGSWTRDGRKILFTLGNADGDVDIYLADVETKLWDPVVKTSKNECAPSLTPDGSAVLFWQGDWLKRVPLDGGPAVEILRSATPVHGFWGAVERVMCAAESGARCVLKRIEGEETVFYEFDPTDGALGKEIARLDFSLMPPSGRCDLAPDGMRVAMAVGGKLAVLDLADKSMRELRQKDWQGRANSVSWSGDGTWLCVTGSGGAATHWLARVDLDGRTRFLWRSEEEGIFAAVARPSPHGTYIAFTASRGEYDIWMLEDF